MMENGELSDPADVQREHNNGMAAIEAQVREKYGISPEQLAAAQEAFAADTEVQACTQALRALFEINLPDPSSVPADLTADMFIEKFRIQIDMTNDVLEQAFVETKAVRCRRLAYRLLGVGFPLYYLPWVRPETLSRVQNHSSSSPT